MMITMMMDMTGQLRNRDKRQLLDGTVIGLMIETDTGTETSEEGGKRRGQG